MTSDKIKSIIPAFSKSKKLKWDKWQEEFLKTKGDKILCCGRQVGKSEICAADAAEYAINNPNTKPIVIIAPTERQAYALFTKVLNYLSREYPEMICINGRDKPTKERIKLKNGVEIYCLPVGNAGVGIRFLTIGRLYIDEASRIPEEVFEAVEPALLTTGGEEILLSTPYGAFGTFYEIWINKDNAFNSFSRFSVTSEEVIKNREICGTWTAQQREKALEKIEQAKKRWTKRRYAQEYLGEFVQDLLRWFPDDLIKECCVLKRQEEIKKDGDYYLGVDIARMGEDKITYEILLKNSDEDIIQVENIIEQKKLTFETENKIIELDKKYKFRDRESIGIDAGSGTLGVSIFDHLLLTDVKNKIVAINNAKRVFDKDGKEKGKLLKIDLYENLRALMERRIIKLLDDDEVIDSLRSVQYEFLIKENKETQIRIYGDNTHVVEGLIRAAWLAKQKTLNLQVYSIKI